jgi:hypothetical protein
MIHKIQDYINARLALFRLDIIEKTSKGFTLLVLFLILGFFFVMALLFISIAVALLISKSIGTWWSGFAIISLIYFLLFLIILALRKVLIERPLLDLSVKYLFEQQEDDDEEDEEEE